MNPEEIFNMFFGGGMGAGRGFGGPGFRVHTGGFGPGFGFQAGGMPRQQQTQQQQQEQGPIQRIMQFLPIFLFFLMSFFNMPDETASSTSISHFSLSKEPPFTNERYTSLTRVKDIPYFVNDKFTRMFGRDRYQLAQVERMVERSYEKYLKSECKAQKRYQDKLFNKAKYDTSVPEDQKDSILEEANTFKLSRCIELDELFPPSNKKKKHRNGF